MPGFEHVFAQDGGLITFLRFVNRAHTTRIVVSQASALASGNDLKHDSSPPAATWRWPSCAKCNWRTGIDTAMLSMEMFGDIDMRFWL